MAKGFETHRERQNQLSMLGKELTRRSRAQCELCTESGVPLSIYEVPPVPKEPDLDQVLHLCETCTTQLEKSKKLEPNRWRILSETIWSEVPAAQVMAVRVLRHIAKAEPWAQEILERADLDEDQETWIQKESIT
ncbi:MAG: phnA protein [Verrucomicrobia bacterium]|nr:phnA protein [Verrucomicrobiota bacterium]